jgi:hypothetical protein
VPYPNELEGIVWLCLDIKEVDIGRVFLLNLVLDLRKEFEVNEIIIDL